MIEQHHAEDKRIIAEKEFHDVWALSTNVEDVDVIKINEAVTSPELRYIFNYLGDIRGKKVFDLGCGLGEASVYFAIRGADVTASDLSPEMVNFTEKLAHKYNCNITKHIASAESLQLKPEQQFDIIYAGNVLHHIDIDKTLSQLKLHLKKDGVFVSWDPVAYNPLINIYRLIATEVRTEDEHPIRIQDLKKINSHFSNIKTKWFWLSALLIFVLMVLAQFRSPNKERFWKSVVYEEKKWAWLFKPLNFIDQGILKVFPFLGWLCWNVVIIAKNDK